MQTIKNETYLDFEKTNSQLNIEDLAEHFIKNVTKISNISDLDYIKLKVIEECTELNEVLIKTLTKKSDLKPNVSKIIEEAGDLFLRLSVLVTKLNIQKEVGDRALDKSRTLIKTTYINK